MLNLFPNSKLKVLYVSLQLENKGNIYCVHMNIMIHAPNKTLHLCMKHKPSVM